MCMYLHSVVLGLEMVWVMAFYQVPYPLQLSCESLVQTREEVSPVSIQPLSLPSDPPGNWDLPFAQISSLYAQ